MNIALTGANGFLGTLLAKEISRRSDFNLTSVVRRPVLLNHGRQIVVPDVSQGIGLSAALANQDVVIHAAARTHVFKDQAEDPLSEYRKVNVCGTLLLARRAVEAGVKRFIFISSVKVNGEQTLPGKCFTAADKPAPVDPYGISKLEAEEVLLDIAERTQMEVVIIRPPLVYGPGVKGNFAALVGLVKKGLPLPLGSVHNKRSLVGIDNLISLVIACVDHPAAANQVFLVSDGHDLSTSSLLRELARSMNCPARLIPVPASVLEVGVKLVGKGALAQRLLGSLQVDISKTRELLDWAPPLSIEDGLRRCVTA